MKIRAKVYKYKIALCNLCGARATDHQGKTADLIDWCSEHNQDKTLHQEFTIRQTQETVFTINRREEENHNE